VPLQRQPERCALPTFAMASAGLPGC
jgi:hypothetical protein